MSVGHEQNFDLDHKTLAESFVEASRDIGSNDIQCFRDMENRFEQWGQLMGTLKIKDKEEQELFLWSCRTRIVDQPLWAESVTFARLYMYFEDGYPLKIENVSIEDFLHSYTSAYSVSQQGGIQAISECNINSELLHAEQSKLNLSFKLCQKTRKINIEFDGTSELLHLGPNSEYSMVMKPFKVSSCNGDLGFGILHLGNSSNQHSEYVNAFPLLEDKKYKSNDKLVSPLTADECKSSLIAGGKGYSLALLTELSAGQKTFKVPKGIIVTTSSFENHIKENSDINFSIQRLIDVSGEKVNGNLQEACLKCMTEFQATKLSSLLRSAINDELLTIYESIENVRFSVRSSACGEDSEDLSAAGQMLTVLGIRGISNIADSIVKCWASKFGFEAVQYSRQNGQSIRLPMAVVVQEMVPSEISGVMFTVDPVTGDPSNPYITANYGLGETVVSSLAEPDTIVLQREENNLLSVKERIIGSKKTQIHMKSGDGTEEKNLFTSSADACLSDEWSVRLGLIGILVEKCFCAPRDIEWALHKGTLYLLQARPVTTLHTETDFELMHDQDTPVRSVHEFWTRANTGEVFLGATSPLGISTVVSCMDIFAHRSHILREKFPTKEFCPYYYHILPVTHKQVAISCIDTLYRAPQKEITNLQRAMEVAMFGRVLQNEKMVQAGIKKYGYASEWRQVYTTVFIFLYSFKIPNLIKSCREKFEMNKIPLEKFTTLDKAWKGLLEQFHFFNTLNDVHGLTSFSSSFFNFLVMNTLAKEKGAWDNELYSEFASVLSSCTDIESADVPVRLQELGQDIFRSHGIAFSKLPVDEAYSVLMNDEGRAGKLFKEFLQKHGHRCIKEFDVYSTSWEMNPASLIPTLQKLVASPNITSRKVTSDGVSTENVMSKIKTPLHMFSRLILKVILPWSRKGVSCREQTKSMLIRIVNSFRLTCHQLGKLLVEEGMLPSKDLIFFLTLEEIKEMIKTRKPGLVPKAIRRSRLHSKLDKLQFPEIMNGIPKPIKEEEDASNYSSSFMLTGTPVCQGKVTGLARVVTTLSEASTIQSGDILITHSTDIGWSPYFPLLSGVVTVLGGLISHGAVVAREYGLPCVVGVAKAMSSFKSGDLVILDGTKGTISKILKTAEESEQFLSI